MKFGVIGYGKMGSAIVRGAISAGVLNRKDICVYEVSECAIAELSVQGIATAKNASELFNKCDTVLFAIKPQEAKAVIASVENLANCGLILSIMAGVPLSAFEALGKIAVARIMPNTCAVIGESSSAICYNSYASKDDIAFTQKLFGAIGKYVEVEEKFMDDIIPLHGSFNAYAYLFMKAFIDSAVKRGIDEETAKSLVTQSMIGSAKMAQTYGDLNKLISDVCSKGGTTLAGLEKLYDGNFEKIIDDCSIACANRSKELGKEFFK